MIIPDNKSQAQFKINFIEMCRIFQYIFIHKINMYKQGIIIGHENPDPKSFYVNIKQTNTKS